MNMVIILTWAATRFEDIRIVSDSGGVKLLFDSLMEAEEWIENNDAKIDNFYRIVDL